MMRLLSVVAALLTLASAFGLYRLKYDARRLEMEVQAKERTLEKLQSDVAVQRAEKAYLERPERIEKLARGQGLGPIRSTQYLRADMAPAVVPNDEPKPALRSPGHK